MNPTPGQIRSLSRADPVLGAALKRPGPFPGFPDPEQHGFRSHFHALARSVVYQAVSTRAAASVLLRVVALTPGRAFPRPEQFLEIGFVRLRAAGDLAVREGLRILDGLEERPTPKQLAARAEVWRPLRSVGSWVMWELIHEREARKAASA